MGGMDHGKDKKKPDLPGKDNDKDKKGKKGFKKFF
jgi:hypothetical protein